ncbi:hypothetical protein DS843_24355 [Roseomonas genomospecies 6]|uniref:Uncharacterized protein n=1 Tax=Roseomonas genomospecies 6 TaxID=214106 RepID=A0A9W7KPY0_9PROT|nr:hypothetical protein DS843_24355 [Roseomonas genomospecies 6]
MDPPKTSTAPTVPDTTSNVAENDNEGETNTVGIFDRKRDEEGEFRAEVANLINIRCEMTSDLFIQDFVKNAKPDYFVDLAKTKLLDELRAGCSAEDAIALAQQTIREAEEKLREQIDAILIEASNKAMASFMKQVDSNKVLNDPTSGKLLQRVLDYRSSSLQERRTALKALQNKSKN